MQTVEVRGRNSQPTLAGSLILCFTLNLVHHDGGYIIKRYFCDDDDVISKNNTFIAVGKNLLFFRHVQEYFYHQLKRNIF